MAKFRIPCFYIRRRFPNLFLATCIAAVILFTFNVLSQFQTQTLVERKGSQSVQSKDDRVRLLQQKLAALQAADDVTDDVCRMPKLTLATDANRYAFYRMPPLACTGDVLFTSDTNSVIRINQTVLGSRKLEKCEYTSIEWVTDDMYKFSDPVIVEKEPFEYRMNSDFYRVQCYLEKTPSKRKLLEQSQTSNNIAVDTHNAQFKNPRKRDIKLFHQHSINTGDNQASIGGVPVRRLLADDNAQSEAEDGHVIQQPRMIGSMGMPDLPDLMLQRKVDDVAADVNDAAIPDVNDNNDDNRADNADDGENGDLPDNDEAADDEFADDDDNHHRYDDYAALGDDYNVADNDGTYDDGGYWPGRTTGDFDQYFTQTAVQDDVLERIRTTKPNRNSLQMNVLMFALDSMSHMSYQRKLPLTYAYLRDELKAVILNGYNIVGDATTAAMLPILTGKNETELPEVRRGHAGSAFVDKFPFVWNKYEQSGYVTLFAEDQPAMGTFQLRFNGFEERPVDHYIRPFWQSIHDAQLHKRSPEWCIGGQEEHTFLLNYLRDFMIKYKDVPKFGLGFSGDLTHADNNPAQYIDADLAATLRYLKEHGHLDNTLLIVMGDHGARYSAVRGTVQGKLEERLPFMSFTFPDKFKRDYPQLYANLQSNVDRLTTPFDVHETLLSLLDVTRATRPMKPDARGLSLLRAIPQNRTCAAAHIDVHWCTCLRYENVDVSDNLVTAAAQLVVKHINKKTERANGLCQELSIKRIKDAKIVVPNEKVLMFVRADPELRVTNFSKEIELDVLHYQLIVQTRPSDALYEATVQYNVKANEWSVYADVSRVNAYGSQPHCVTKTLPELRKYCYCKQQKQPAKH